MLIDVLIVGQGLAGSLLAWRLLQEGLSVLVIDDGALNASQIAAGLINPITGQRLVKSAQVDELLPAAMAVYRELADVFKQDFFIPMPMLRQLSNAKMQQSAEQRLASASYQIYLDGLELPKDEWGGDLYWLRQRHTGYLRTENLLACLRQYFIDRQSYRNVVLDYADIRLQPTLIWQDVQPGHIVFCEGYRAQSNPWFGSLPFQVAKGEILDCWSGRNCSEAILNYGDWYLPLGEQRFKLGATFDVNFTHSEPTFEAQSRLLSGLYQIMPGFAPLEVRAQRAGIRPTTLDKQPFVGTHPHVSCLHIFNGFGAKGSLAIPGYAQRFVAWLKRQIPLTAHCDVRRYHETHFPA